MNIKALVFDIGDVVIFEPASEAREILCKKFNINQNEFKDYAIRNLKLSHIGKLNGEQFFRGLINELRLKISARELVNEWILARNETCSWNFPVVEFIEKIKGKYLLVSFTNSTFLNDSVDIRKRVYNFFDLNLISQERGLYKPDLPFYELLVSELKLKGVAPQEILFIDDREENLIPAKNLGINTLLFDNKVNIEEEVKRFGVNV